MIDRIIESYKLASKDFLEHKETKSTHWQRYYNNVEKFSNRENIQNFRQDLSKGLDDSKNDFQLKDLVECFNELGEKFVYKNLCTKNVGNSPNIVDFNGYIIDSHNLIQLYWYKDLETKVFLKKKIKTVCEIGGGYGSLARMILANHNCKFISIDLPEANLMTAYYLKQHFPKLKIYTYAEYVKTGMCTSKSLEEYDVFILPPWTSFSETLEIDLFINARSMMEMNKQVIANYFDFIHTRITDDGYFLNINRYIKYSKDTGIPICLHEYHYDENWEVVESKTTKQYRIHLLMTKRKFSHIENSITDELIKIQEKSKEFKDALLEKETPFKLLLFSFSSFVLIKLFGGKTLSNLGRKLISMNEVEK